MPFNSFYLILNSTINFLNRPHSPMDLFDTLDRAYYIDKLDIYFEYESISEDGYTVQIQCYREYEMINGQWRGVLKEGELKTYQKDNNGKAVELMKA